METSDWGSSQLNTRGTCPSFSQLLVWCPCAPPWAPPLSRMPTPTAAPRERLEAQLVSHTVKDREISGWKVIFTSCCAINAINARKRDISQPRERTLQPVQLQPRCARAILADRTGSTTAHICMQAFEANQACIHIADARVNQQEFATQLRCSSDARGTRGQD